MAKRSEILIEALPYIKKYFGKTVVIKYGGNAMIDEALKEAVISDIVLLSLVGIKVVVVHGGGPEINDMLARVNKEAKFINGLRYTDEETMEIVQMVLCGKVNKDLVALITHAGGSAIGLSGLDSGLIRAKKLSDELGLVGEVTSINPKPVIDLLDNGYIPVISTVALGDEGSFNVNADIVASKLSISLNAEKLILLTDVKGLLMDPKDDSTLLHSVNVSGVPMLVKNGVIKGGMIPKVDCCVEAIRNGVKQTIIQDGRVKHSILMEMLSDNGEGTLFY